MKDEEIKEPPCCRGRAWRACSCVSVVCTVCLTLFLLTLSFVSNAAKGNICEGGKMKEVLKAVLIDAQVNTITPASRLV